MMTNRHSVSLTAEQLERLERELARFAHSWSEEALSAELVKLPILDDPLRIPLLEGFVRLDLHMRWQRGESARLEEYLERYPELGTIDTAPVDLILAEMVARKHFGPSHRSADDLGDDSVVRNLCERFPGQAEELQKRIQPATGSTESNPSVEIDFPALQSTPSSLNEETELDAVTLPESFGRYRIIRRLGQGGMGAVFLAHDTRLDRQVALKVPRYYAALAKLDPADPRYQEITDNLERFYREARAAATLTHPNLCPVFDVGEQDGVPYLTMAFIDGWPLTRFTGGDPKRKAAQDLIGAKGVQRTRQLSELAIAAVLRKVALAIFEAHKIGILHRDLKPSNIMLNRRGEPIVMDFGLARWLQQDPQDVRPTRSGAILGAPVYMSPEQVYGHTELLGPATDVYSMGVILYELLTGKLPFDGLNANSVFAQSLMLEPRKPSSHRPDVDPRLEAICLKAMAKAIADRYPTMMELAAALGEYIRAKRIEDDRQQGIRPEETGVREVAPAPAGRSEMVADPGKMRSRSPDSRFTESAKPVPGKTRNVRRIPSWLYVALCALLLVIGIQFFFLLNPGNVGHGRTEGSAADFGVDAQPKTPDAPAPAVPVSSRPVRQREMGAAVTRLAVWPGAFTRKGNVIPDEEVRLLVALANGTMEVHSLLLDEPVLVLRGHRRGVLDVAFSPELSKVLSAGDDTTVRLWDLAAGARLKTFRGHEKKVWCCDFSPDGKRIITGSADASALLWDLETGAVLRRFEGHTRDINGVVFSPDGKQIVTASWDGTLRLWDTATGKPVHTFTGPGFTTVTYSPDGKHLIAGGRDTIVRIWEVDSGRLSLRLRGPARGVGFTAFSPGGRLLACGGSSGEVLLWDWRKEALLHRFEGHKAGVTAVRFTPEGARLISGSKDKKVFVWDLPPDHRDPAPGLRDD
jgi:WD40 repeat protein/serine/threonine protein kinase